MGLCKTINEKIAEGGTLKDVKHIVKRQTEGNAKKEKNYLRYCEEAMIQKMLSRNTSVENIVKKTEEKDSGFDLHWTEKRIARQAEDIYHINQQLFGPVLFIVAGIIGIIGIIGIREQYELFSTTRIR